MSFMLYFVIPVKAKYLGIFYVIMEGVSFITGSTVGRVTIFLSLLNVVIFFIMTKNIFGNLSNKKMNRRKEFNSQVKIKPVKSAHHKCAVCGRTELDGEDLVFRYCSKCNGNYEYCQDHLYTHTHVQ